MANENTQKKIKIINNSKSGHVEKKTIKVQKIRKRENNNTNSNNNNNNYNSKSQL